MNTADLLKTARKFGKTHPSIFSPQQLERVSVTADPSKSFVENENVIKANKADYFDSKASFKIVLEILLIAKAIFEGYCLWKKAQNSKVELENRESKPGSLLTTVKTIKFEKITTASEFITTVSAAVEKHTHTTYARKEVRNITQYIVEHVAEEDGHSKP